MHKSRRAAMEKLTRSFMNLYHWHGGIARPNLNGTIITGFTAIMAVQDSPDAVTGITSTSSTGSTSTVTAEPFPARVASGSESLPVLPDEVLLDVGPWQSLACPAYMKWQLQVGERSPGRGIIPWTSTYNRTLGGITADLAADDNFINALVNVLELSPGQLGFIRSRRLISSSIVTDSSEHDMESEYPCVGTTYYIRIVKQRESRHDVAIVL